MLGPTNFSSYRSMHSTTSADVEKQARRDDARPRALRPLNQRRKARHNEVHSIVWCRKSIGYTRAILEAARNNILLLLIHVSRNTKASFVTKRLDSDEFM